MSIEESVLETAKGMHKAGVIDDKRLAWYEGMCKPEKIRAFKDWIKIVRLRVKAKPKQFAICLKVDVEDLKAWEAGKAYPNNAVLKRVDLVARKGLEALKC